MEIPLEARITIPPGVLSRELSSQSVLLNLNSERYFGLDDVGTRMLSVLTNSPTVQQACDTLLEQYDVDAEVLRRDLLDLIGKLAEHGLVEIHRA